jgi:hypothetical protein
MTTGGRGFTKERARAAKEAGLAGIGPFTRCTIERSSWCVRASAVKSTPTDGEAKYSG